MKMINKNVPLLTTILCLLCTSCEKFLDEKSDAKLVTTDDLESLQALLDYQNNVNLLFCTSGETSADNYYLTEAGFNSLREDYRNQYMWNASHVFTEAAVATNDWFNTYQAVYVCTMILEALENIPLTQSNRQLWELLKGQALALRAYRYLDAAQIWARAYDESTAGTDKGIPLRNTADFNRGTKRSSVRKTYDQIIGDFKESIPLLPVTNINAHRASRPFAYAALARTYLTMRKYEEAYLYADSCLQLRNELMDFNTLDADVNYPVDRLNVENIFLAYFATAPALNGNVARIDEELYNSYSSGDLRKVIFFAENADGSYRFKGNYSMASNLFAGVSCNEVYLIRSECLARMGQVEAAVADLNYLLRNRWVSGEFTPISGDSGKQEILDIILRERRKELLMRGLRWMDLKRLNKEGRNISISRRLGDTEWTLSPNDPRYALAIPEDIIAIAGIEQNER